MGTPKPYFSSLATPLPFRSSTRSRTPWIGNSLLRYVKIRTCGSYQASRTESKRLESDWRRGGGDIGYGGRAPRCSLPVHLSPSVRLSLLLRVSPPLRLLLLLRLSSPPSVTSPPPLVSPPPPPRQQILL